MNESLFGSIQKWCLLILKDCALYGRKPLNYGRLCLSLLVVCTQCCQCLFAPPDSVSSLQCTSLIVGDFNTRQTRHSGTKLLFFVRTLRARYTNAQVATWPHKRFLSQTWWWWYTGHGSPLHFSLLKKHKTETQWLPSLVHWPPRSMGSLI